jgi:hypothetical protein
MVGQKNASVTASSLLFRCSRKSIVNLMKGGSMQISLAYLDFDEYWLRHNQRIVKENAAIAVRATSSRNKCATRKLATFAGAIGLAGLR